MGELRSNYPVPMIVDGLTGLPGNKRYFSVDLQSFVYTPRAI